MKKRAALGFVFVTALVDIIGIGLIIPITPQLIQEVSGFTEESDVSFYGGLLFMSYSLMQFLCAPILGGLSDRYGRRPVLLIALFGFAVDYVIVAYAPTLIWLFGARLVSGICGSSLTVVNAYVADISSPADRARNFGLIGAAFGLGFVIGPALGGVLGGIGTRIPFLVAAGLTFLNFLYGYFVIPESLKKENRRPFDFKRANPFATLFRLFKFKTLTGLLICLFFIYIAQHATHSNWSFFTDYRFEWGPLEIGLSLMFVGIMVSIVQGGVVGPFVKNFGEVKAIYAGLFFNAMGLLFMGIVWEPWMVYMVIVPYAFGGLAGPSLQSIMTSQVEPNAQGELQGGLTSLMTFTNVLGPLIMTTWMFSYFTDEANGYDLPGAPFFLGTFLAIIGFLVAYRALSKYHSS